MASNARVFFAGVATTFVVLAVGFSGGLILAKSALHDRPQQLRASSERPRHEGNPASFIRARETGG